MTDIAVDTSALSLFAREPAVRDLVCERILGDRARLAVPIQALSEIVDSEDTQGVTNRLTCVAALATSLRERFLVTQDVLDLVLLEREQRITSVPEVPDRAGLIDSFLSPDFMKDLPELRKGIQKHQMKDISFGRDLDSRKNLSKLFAPYAKRLPGMVGDLRNNDWFWTTVFVQAKKVSDRGRYAARMRLNPKRYATAVMSATYLFLNAMGSIFVDTGLGRFAGILRAPRRNDRIDGTIAACASHARVFLTEDEGQRIKVNYIATQFGLRLIATSVRGWLV